MRRLAISIMLALVLVMLLGTSALAASPNDGQGNMPGKAADLGDNWKGLNGAIRHIGQGGGYGNSPISWAGCGINVSANHAISNIMEGDPPKQPWWWAPVP